MLGWTVFKKLQLRSFQYSSNLYIRAFLTEFVVYLKYFFTVLLAFIIIFRPFRFQVVKLC